MPSIHDIDWDQVSLEKGMTPEKVIQAYNETLKDLVHLDNEFNRFFSGKRKKAKIPMMTLSIFESVNLYVHYNPNDQIDVSRLLPFIASDDRKLFSDVCTFVYNYFHEKPKTNRTLNQFRGMLVYYLCSVGF